MARKPKAPEQDSSATVPSADILSDTQQPEAPPFEVNTQPPEVTAEETPILEEGKATLFEMGEELPNPGEVVIPADLTEQLLAEKNGPKIAAAKEAEAAATEMPASEQEDTRQEWEKPLADIEAEQQTKRRGRPPKAAEDKATSGQVGAVDKVA